MGLQKITFDGANVTSKIDADLYHFLFSNSIGILNGLKNNINYSLSGSNITFQDGYISIYGRLIYVENGTQVSILLDSSKYGYVVIGVNTVNNTILIYTKEQTGSYPTLTTTNLSSSDGLYEFPICAYTKTNTAVTLNTYFTRSFIKVNQSLIDSSKSSVIDELAAKQISLTLVQSGVYKFTMDSSELTSSLLVAVLENNTIITIPGKFFFINSSSSKTIAYQYGGSYFSLRLSYVSGTVTLTCGLTTHKITSLFLYK